jgi:hypothetical protein
MQCGTLQTRWAIFLTNPWAWVRMYTDIKCAPHSTAYAVALTQLPAQFDTGKEAKNCAYPHRLPPKPHQPSHHVVDPLPLTIAAVKSAL